MYKKSLKEIAYEIIKENIFNGTFEYGQIYSAQYFADFLKMSRTPVREAILDLSNERVVTILPNRGIKIKELDEEFLDELAQVRNMIDGYCASLLAESSNSINGLIAISKLNQLIEEEEVLLNNNDENDTEIISKWYDLDAAFHNTITDFIDNRYISENINDIQHYIKYIGILTARIENRKRESIEENKQILSAIISGDAELAYERASAHSAKIFTIMKRYLKQNSHASLQP